MRARAARIRLCSHIHHISPATSHFAALADPPPAATSSCTFMPMPSARYLAQQHALLQFPRPTRTCPSGTPTQAPQRQPVAKRHTAMPMAPSVCHTHTQTPCNNEMQPPRETSLPMQAANNAGLTGAGPRMQPAREPAAAHHESGRATPTATTTAQPACLSTHGTLAWGAEAARVRIPNGGAQRGGRRRQGFC